MTDEDMKIYIPRPTDAKETAEETDEVKVYTINQ